ncbi:hypothetical protein [Georgenia sp. SUBG003]|uniref:hypothetical protein n=1 Tax=Georgenia sp. SUBG003 TaxID=1497974 RepID=UPI0004D4FEFB|nr:hypothetical protein DA06_19735 [Georgenia sp. SUBG003]
MPEASASHQDGWSPRTLASISSGRLRGPSSQARTPSRSARRRTVRAVNPYPRPTAAMSVGGNVTVSIGSPEPAKWWTSAP